MGRNFPRTFEGLSPTPITNKPFLKRFSCSNQEKAALCWRHPDVSRVWLRTPSFSQEAFERVPSSLWPYKHNTFHCTNWDLGSHAAFCFSRCGIGRIVMPYLSLQTKGLLVLPRHLPSFPSGGGFYSHLDSNPGLALSLRGAINRERSVIPFTAASSGYLLNDEK